MSEQDGPVRNNAEHVAESSHGAGESLPSPGALLRQGREAAGVHIASLAAALKVSVSKIEALEQDQFDQLPDAVFVRALAASVCRILKLDSEPILDRLPPTHNVKPPPQNRGINEPFRARHLGASASVWNSISRPAVLAGIVLLLGALILVFLPTLRQHQAFSSSAQTEAVTQDGSGVALPGLLSGATDNPDVAAGESSPLASDGTAGAPLTAASGPLPGPSPGPSLESSAALSGAGTNASAANSSGSLAFSATGPSWIKVVDGAGQVVLNRTLQAGEVADISGAFPFAVTVGRTDVTQVKVRGQVFDLAAVSKNNVARFEVK